jgi:hypothetical protein
MNNLIEKLKQVIIKYNRLMKIKFIRLKTIIIIIYKVYKKVKKDNHKINTLKIKKVNKSLIKNNF